MSQLRRFGWLAILMSLTLVVVACGDETGDDTDDTSATTAAGDGDGADVVMEGIAFQPGETTVDVGTTVTWTNEDGVTHTTTSDDELWDSGNLSTDETFSFTFDEPGTYTYFCQIHPSQMQATIVVEG